MTRPLWPGKPTRDQHNFFRGSKTRKTGILRLSGTHCKTGKTSAIIALVLERFYTNPKARIVLVGLSKEHLERTIVPAIQDLIDPNFLVREHKTIGARFKGRNGAEIFLATDLKEEFKSMFYELVVFDNTCTVTQEDLSRGRLFVLDESKTDLKRCIQFYMSTKLEPYK